MYRTGSTYPANYYPRYSEDPRYIGDPRYYGRGSRYGAPEYGGQPPGKVNTGVIFGCAVFCVFIIIVTMGGLAVGLALGLSGDGSSNTGSSSDGSGVSVPVVPTIAPVNPGVDSGDGTDTGDPATSNPGSGNTEPLAISCPDNIQRFVSGSSTTAIVDWPSVSITGGSGMPTVTEVPSSGSSFPIGETPVNIIVTDGAETVTCSFVVQVLPSDGSVSLLSAICPDDILRTTAAGETTVAVFWDPPTVSNANGVPTITYSRARGSLFNIGATTVVATVTDASATVQCDFSITVEDGGLDLECPASMVVNTNTGETFATVNYPNPRVTGATSGIINIEFDPARNAPLPVGVTDVVASVTNEGRTAQCSFQITVQDREAPVLSCDSGGDRSTDSGRSYATINWTPPTAVDNTGGSLPVTVSREPGQFTVGRHTIVATATDSNNNVGSCTWTYDVSDNENPSITCPASFTARLLSGLPNVVVTYEDQVSASDNIPSGLNINVTPSDIYPLGRGTHTIIATATDASGNFNSCSFMVTVSDFCGIGAMTLTPRIIGGTAAQEGAYPWQVSIFLGTHFCGGVIIDDNWILTAAHCFEPPISTTGVTIIAGDNSLSTASVNRQTRSIAQVVNHPSYVSPPTYDISLLRLSQPLAMTDYVQPACLSTTTEEQDLYGSNSCYVAGWGTIDPDATIDTAVPEDNLRAVKLDDIISSQDCQQYHTISDNSFCAGVLTGGRDACLGDSGGGLVCPDVDNLWHVIGIVSAGAGCALANTLAVYTRVSQFLDFTHAYLGAELLVVDLRSGGSFSSGTNYPPNVIRGWRFRRFGGRTIRLEFPNFELASGDTLTLGHGLNPWDTDTVIMTMGSDFSLVTFEVESTYTDIWFRFRSNGSGTANGFVIRVEVIT